MDNLKGNLSTIGKFIATMIAGWVISLALAHHIQLGLTEKELAEIIGALLGLIYGYIDAKYPNSMKWLGNSIQTPPEINQILNDEYECDQDDGC